MSRPDPQQLAIDCQSAIAEGDWPRAETGLRALAELVPDNASLHYNLGLTLSRQDRHADALTCFETTLSLEPDHANAMFERAASLMALGRLDAADTGFSSYLDRVAADPDAILNRARIAIRQGRPEDALERLDALPGTDAPEIALARAEALRDLKRVSEASALLGDLYRDAPALRPAILKVMSHGPAGRVPLRLSTLAQPER